MKSLVTPKQPVAQPASAKQPVPRERHAVLVEKAQAFRKEADGERASALEALLRLRGAILAKTAAGTPPYVNDAILYAEVEPVTRKSFILPIDSSDAAALAEQLQIVDARIRLLKLLGKETEDTVASHIASVSFLSIGGTKEYPMPEKPKFLSISTFKTPLKAFAIGIAGVVVPWIAASHVAGTLTQTQLVMLVGGVLAMFGGISVFEWRHNLREFRHESELASKINEANKTGETFLQRIEDISAQKFESSVRGFHDAVARCRQGVSEALAPLEGTDKK